ATVTLAPGGCAVLEPALAIAGRRRSENVFLIFFKDLRLRQKRSPDQAVAKLGVQPTVRRGRQTVPAANERLVADRDPLFMAKLRGCIWSDEGHAVASKRIEY